MKNSILLIKLYKDFYLSILYPVQLHLLVSLKLYYTVNGKSSYCNFPSLLAPAYFHTTAPVTTFRF